ncbi:unannotated protein [freshwater metagenome]|uniref:Unannotated protein n=1 Tax=freshwater metagenome TaxID=449393 RepID=A0A6J7CAT3_9ZZZZ
MGAHARGVGPEVGFGQAEAAERLAGSHAGEPLVLLGLGAEGMDAIHRQRTGDTHEGAEPGVARLELETGQPVGHRAGAGATVALEMHTEDAEFSELARKFTCRDGAGLEPAADMWRDAVLDPRAHHVADRALLLAQEGVEVEEGEGRHGGAGHGLLRGLWWLNHDGIQYSAPTPGTPEMPGMPDVRSATRQSCSRRRWAPHEPEPTL